MHRVVVENAIGRLLEPDEEVHHEDEDKHNNELSNLKIMTPGKHAQLHALKRWEGKRVKRVELTCPKCKAKFKLTPKQYKHRKNTNKNGIHCSVSCAASGVGGTQMTPDKVREIRRQAQNGMDHKDIAKIHDVHYITVYKIVTRKRWASVK